MLHRNETFFVFLTFLLLFSSLYFSSLLVHGSVINNSPKGRTLTSLGATLQQPQQLWQPIPPSQQQQQSEPSKITQVSTTIHQNPVTGYKMSVKSSREPITALQANAASSRFVYSSLQITYTITWISGPNAGQPAVNQPLTIKDCLVPGATNNDGHQLYDNRASACTSSTTNPPRPFGTLNYLGTVYSNTNQNPIQATTDSNGQVIIIYVPPVSSKGGIGISGEDQVIATASPNTTPQMITDNIRNRVNLAAMPSSAGCTGTAQYKFQKQTNHGCQFFGTANTNNALLKIASMYNSRQKDCMNYLDTHSTNPPVKGNPCNILWEPTPGNIQNITVDLRDSPTPGVIRLWINAMSSDWGGLLDIGPGGACSTGTQCTFWNPPHSMHNDGKNVDIGFHGLRGGSDADPHIKMLRYIIKVLNSNSFRGWGADNEGRNMSLTKCPGPCHFHVVFKS